MGEFRLKKLPLRTSLGQNQCSSTTAGAGAAMPGRRSGRYNCRRREIARVLVVVVQVPVVVS
eukprot:2564487-Rhodomonas_salina.1